MNAEIVIAADHFYRIGGEPVETEMIIPGQ